LCLLFDQVICVSLLDNNHLNVILNLILLAALKGYISTPTLSNTWSSCFDESDGMNSCCRRCASHFLRRILHSKRLRPDRLEKSMDDVYWYQVQQPVARVGPWPKFEYSECACTRLGKSISTTHLFTTFLAWKTKPSNPQHSRFKHPPPRQHSANHSEIAHIPPSCS
jgi:hypothetical protein